MASALLDFFFFPPISLIIPAFWSQQCDSRFPRSWLHLLGKATPNSVLKC